MSNSEAPTVSHGLKALWVAISLRDPRSLVESPTLNLDIDGVFLVCTGNTRPTI